MLMSKQNVHIILWKFRLNFYISCQLACHCIFAIQSQTFSANKKQCQEMIHVILMVQCKRENVFIRLWPKFYFQVSLSLSLLLKTQKKKNILKTLVRYEYMMTNYLEVWRETNVSIISCWKPPDNSFTPIFFCFCLRRNRNGCRSTN